MQRLILLITILCFSSLPLSANTALDKQFANWAKSDLWREARAAGVSKRTFNRAMANVKLNLKLPDLVLPIRPKKRSLLPPPHAKMRLVTCTAQERASAYIPN